MTNEVDKPDPADADFWDSTAPDRPFWHERSVEMELDQQKVAETDNTPSATETESESDQS